MVQEQDSFAALEMVKPADEIRVRFNGRRDICLFNEVLRQLEREKVIELSLIVSLMLGKVCHFANWDFGDEDRRVQTLAAGPCWNTRRFAALHPWIASVKRL